MGASDKELINMFKKGDEKAFEILVERYQHKVYNTTFRISGNHEDALDLAQESFIRVFQNLSKFKGNSSFSTWLFQISTNICRDELRKRKRKIKESNLDENLYQNLNYQEVNGRDNPEKTSLKKEFQDQLQKQINLLPINQKTILVLREFQGLSYQEIAKVLNISIGTVKSRLSRARRSLREELQNIIKGGIK